MKTYFRRILNDRQIMLGRNDDNTLWQITCKRIVDKGVKADIIQEVKARKGKSVLTSRLVLSNKAMEELVWLYKNHPERTKVFEFSLTESKPGKWEITPGG